MVFIFKAMHMVGVHNRRAGGQTRERLHNLTEECIIAKTKKYSNFYYMYVRTMCWMKLFLFENLFWVYKRCFGFLEVTGVTEGIDD